MFVARTRFDRISRLLDGEKRRRQDAEDKLARQSVTIERLQSQVAHHDDEHPDAPVPTPKPTQGDAELRRQLHLARRALAHLDRQLTDLQTSHEADTRDLHDLRQGVAS